MAEESRKNRPEWDGKHDLYIGVKNDLSPFTVDLKALTRGLVVVGQSGCGKSFMLGRLVEEIVRKTKKSRLLIIDPNSDFVHGLDLKNENDFKKILDKYFSGSLEKEHQKFIHDEFNIFKETARNRKVFNIWGRDLPFDLSIRRLDQSELLSLIAGLNNDPGIRNALRIIKLIAMSMEQYIGEDSKRSDTEFEEVVNLFRSFKGWCDIATVAFLDTKSGRIHDDPEIKDYATYFDNFIELSRYHHEILKVVDIKDLLLLENLLIKITEDNIWYDKESEHFDAIHADYLESDGSFDVYDFGLLKSKTSRILVTYYYLMLIFKIHKKKTEDYRSLIEDTNPKRKGDDPRLRTFILIDEAHNFAPEDTDDPHEKMLGELIHTIAAEGRKYGLHLILATQRPNKVKRGLLGELDNAIIMKMNSRSDLEELAKEMRILDVKLLEPCLSFQGQGNAIAVGEMTRMAPYTQIFKSAPRRTKEGGVDIPFF